MDKTRQERYNLIYGNTARKMEAAEPVRPEPERRKKKVRRKARPKTSARTRKNQQKAMKIDFSFICVLIAAVVIVTGVSLFYLSERAQLMEQRSALSDKKEQLNALLVENENLNLEIEQSINLDEIEKTAKQYGMKEPGSDQIIYYNSTDADYVRQYEDIPDAD